MTRRVRPLAAVAALALAAVAVGLVFAPASAPPPALAADPPPAEAKPPADLALVPGDALGFAHVKVADIWKGDGMKEYRGLVKKAGAAALGVFDADFVPKPSTLDRVTTVLLPPSDKGALRIATVLAFTEPFDRAEIARRYMPKGETKKAGLREYTADPVAGVAVHFADARTLVFGDADTVPAFLALSGKPSAAFAAAVTAAAGKPLTICLNVRKLPFPPDAIKDVPFDLRPLLAADTATLTADAGKAAGVQFALAFPSADDAKAGEKALRKAAQMGRAQLTDARKGFEEQLAGRPRPKDDPRPLDDLPAAAMAVVALGGLNTLDEFLDDPPLKVDGAAVSVGGELPAWAAPYASLAGLSAGLALPAVQKVRNSAARMQASNNLKQIAIAMHQYHDVYNSFPPAAICDKKGKRLLSWRVAILPYIEQNNLFQKFKLDEPWDSENNKQWSRSVIKTYSDPRDSAAKPGETYYKLFVGGGSPFDWVKSKQLAQITDGTSNTLMVVAAGDPVPWAKPDDFEFDPEKKLPDLTKPFGELLVSMCDGSVRTIQPAHVKDFDKLIKLLIQADDGNPIPDF